jgi:hypothetical protein
MRLPLLGTLCLLAGCGGSGPLAQSCEDVGLTPGTAPYQRCSDAKAARLNSATRAAIDTVRSVDVIGPRP